MPITITAILQEYGAYYEKSGQNKARLRKLLLQGTATMKNAVPIKTDETIYKRGMGSMSDVVQAFQKAFTPSGTLTFTPMKNVLAHLKADISVFPDDIEASWLGFLASDDLKRTEWPLVRYMMEEYIIPKILENLELKAIYKGVAVDPEEGVAGSPEDAMDGIQILIQRIVDAHNAQTITGIGSLVKATIFDQVEAFVDGIPQVYQTVPVNLFMEPLFYKAYLRDKRTQGFYNITSADKIDDTVDFGPQKIISCPSMAGTAEIWATPQGNLLDITKKDQNKSNFEIQGLDRQVKLLTDWWQTPGFDIEELVWTNIPKTVVPPVGG